MLDAILSHDAVGVAQLVEITGLHANTLREHLGILEATGFVTATPEHVGARGRPRRLYRAATRDSAPASIRRRIADAARHGDLLRRVLAPEVGASLPAAANHQLDAVWEHLDDLGLDPDVDEEHLVIAVHPDAGAACGAGSGVVCHVQAELVRTVLDCAGGPVQLATVEQGDGTAGCRLHLRIDGVARACDAPDGARCVRCSGQWS